MDKILVFLFGVLGFWFLYVIFVFAPVQMYTEAECLRKGYPNYVVTVGLERYCTTLDGAVTFKVENLK